MKPVKTWILLADANRARLLENSGPGSGLVQLETRTFEDADQAKPSDSEGRTFDSFSHSRHKLETNVERDTAFINNANETFSRLKRSLEKRQFDRLIICAPPKVLGVFRRCLPVDIKEKVIAELPKDLTRISTDDLSDHFSEILML